MFWKDCIEAFYDFSVAIKVTSFEDFLSEPIFYNSQIKIDRKTFLKKKWLEKGITQICDLFNQGGDFLTLNEFNNMYDLNVSFLEYHGVISAIVTYLRKTNIKKVKTNISLDDSPVQRKLCSIKKGSKLYYHTLTSSNIPNTAMPKWQHHFVLNLNWPIIYLKPFVTTQEIKLRWFQYRILHRILTTNTFAYKLKLIDSEMCTFCNEKKESLEHLFWECNIVQNFWNNFINWLLKSCNHIHNLELSLEFVIFGCKDNTKTDNIFDLLLLLAKYFIYKCKVKNVQLNITHFKNEVKQRYMVEKHIHFSKNCLNKFFTKWSMYRSLFENV